ncbi:hypothetical protein [Duganella alba]|nr:hypothetical protein [Duganella alba]
MKKFLKKLILSDKFNDTLAYIVGAVMLIGFLGLIILAPRS